MSDNPFESPASIDYDRRSNPGRMPWWLTLVLVLGLLFVVACLILPAVRSFRGGARHTAYRNSCRNQIKQIGFALENYYEKHGAYPPAYTVDAEGKPLHSWRTLLLPYLEEQALYDKIDLTKPWNDPVNAVALKTVIQVYQCPSAMHDSDSNLTSYLAVVTPQSCLRPGTPTTKAELTDDPARTVVVMEVADEKAVPWMAPTDVDGAFFVGQLREGEPGPSWPHHHLLFADGSIQEFDSETSDQQRRAMITIGGKDECVVQ